MEKGEVALTKLSLVRLENGPGEFIYSVALPQDSTAYTQMTPGRNLLPRQVVSRFLLASQLKKKKKIQAW